MPSRAPPKGARAVASPSPTSLDLYQPAARKSSVTSTFARSDSSTAFAAMQSEPSVYRTAVSERKLASHECQRRIPRRQTAFELCVLHCVQHFLKPGPGDVARRDQIISADQGRGSHFLGWNGSQFLLREFVNTEIAMTGQTIGTVQRQVLIEVGHAQKFLQGRLFHPGRVPKTHVIVDQGQNLLSVIGRKAQAPADFLR